MRTRTGCEQCRERHVKCVKRSMTSKCDRCVEHNRKCVQTSLNRFRPVKSVSLKARDGRAASKQALTYDSFQVWVDVPNKVDFGSSSEDASTVEAPENKDFEPVPDSGRRRSLTHTGVRDASPSDYPHASWENALTTVWSKPSMEIQSRAKSAEPSTSALLAPGRTPIMQMLNAHESPQRMSSQHSLAQHTAMSPPTSKPSPQYSASRNEMSTYPSQTSPASARSSSHTSMRPGPLSSNSASPAFSISPAWPFQSAREAKLFHHYVKNISPWIDICDSNSYFGREVPRRVAHHPIIASAIFAFSSRHLSLLSATEVDNSPHYVDEALQILLSILEDPLGQNDENLLAAVILLRSHEELSDNDERCHSLGTARILNSITAGASDGGLRESASWICLRQHIYLSLTGQEPLTLDLQNYEHSGVFTDSSDEAWANKIIYVFAHILNYVFGSGIADHSVLDPVRWADLEARVANWYLAKPWYFSALWSDLQEQSGLYGWPELLVSHPAHAVGLQYYCLCKIVLAIYDPKLSKLGFASHRLRKNSEVIVVDNLRMAIGLAVSNPDVTNAMFQGSHILAVCGSYLQDEADQRAAVDFLVGMKKTMGWNTDHIIRDLHEQWGNG